MNLRQLLIIALLSTLSLACEDKVAKGEPPDMYKNERIEGLPRLVHIDQLVLCQPGYRRDGTTTFWYDKSGNVIVYRLKVTDSRDIAHRYEFQLSREEVKELETIFTGADLMRCKLRARYTCPGEGRQQIWVKTEAGRIAVLSKPSADTNNDFDSVYDFFVNLISKKNPEKSFESEEYDYNYSPQGFPTVENLDQAAEEALFSSRPEK